MVFSPYNDIWYAYSVSSKLGSELIMKEKNLLKLSKLRCFSFTVAYNTYPNILKVGECSQMLHLIKCIAIAISNRIRINLHLLCHSQGFLTTPTICQLILNQYSSEHFVSLIFDFYLSLLFGDFNTFEVFTYM